MVRTIPGSKQPRIGEIIGVGDRSPGSGVVVLRIGDAAQRIASVNCDRASCGRRNDSVTFLQLLIDRPGLSESHGQFGAKRDAVRTEQIELFGRCSQARARDLMRRIMSW